MLTITSLIYKSSLAPNFVACILHPWSVSMQSLAATNIFPRVILSEVDNLFDLYSLVPRLSPLEPPE